MLVKVNKSNLQFGLDVAVDIHFRFDAKICLEKVEELFWILRLNM